MPSNSKRLGDAGPLGSCAEYFAALDQRAVKAHVLDPGAFRVKGYPYLRVNRFLASFRNEIAGPAALTAWVDHMQTLDQEGRRYEIANMARASRSGGPASDPEELFRPVASCGNLLKAADFQEIKHVDKVRESASAPGEYIWLRRALGLYPLARIFVSRGVDEWQARERARFSREPPSGWRTIRYLSETSTVRSPVRELMEQTKRDALGIPVYSPEARQALFRHFAPVWEVQTQSDHDRIGALAWNQLGRLEVDTRQPLTYTLLSFTRFQKEILTQLNYVVWFPSRPKEGPLDLYGGTLDGINLRVTLDRNGEPLLYETVHNCGCYYQAFPTGRLRVHERIDYAEPPLILKAPELAHDEEIITVAMEARTHYVRHVYAADRHATSGPVSYSLADYGLLRSLPAPEGGRRSVFGQDSLVPGSERLERFLLWSTGVLSPGAMRLWGRHAVAFAGERHFDDPFFMEKMFEQAAHR